MTSVLFLLSINVTFLKFQILSCRLNTFSQVSGFVAQAIGFAIFYVRGGRESFHLFCSPGWY